MNGKLFWAWEDIVALFTCAGQVLIDRMRLDVPKKIRYVLESALAARLCAHKSSFFVLVDGSHVFL